MLLPALKVIMAWGVPQETTGQYCTNAHRSWLRKQEGQQGLMVKAVSQAAILEVLPAEHILIAFEIMPNHLWCVVRYRILILLLRIREILWYLPALRISCAFNVSPVPQCSEKFVQHAHPLLPVETSTRNQRC